jgi:hypothetical protein
VEPSLDRVFTVWEYEPAPERTDVCLSSLIGSVFENFDNLVDVDTVQPGCSYRVQELLFFQVMPPDSDRWKREVQGFDRISNP